MWTILVNVGLWFLGLFGFGKPDPYKQGEALGKAEVGQANAEGELNDIAKADVARNSADNDVGSLLNDPANIGPAKP